MQTVPSFPIRATQMLFKFLEVLSRRNKKLRIKYLRATLSLKSLFVLIIIFSQHPAFTWRRQQFLLSVALRRCSFFSCFLAHFCVVFCSAASGRMRNMWYMRSCGRENKILHIAFWVRFFLHWSLCVRPLRRDGTCAVWSFSTYEHIKCRASLALCVFLRFIANIKFADACENIRCQFWAGIDSWNDRLLLFMIEFYCHFLSRSLKVNHSFLIDWCEYWIWKGHSCRQLVCARRTTVLSTSREVAQRRLKVLSAKTRNTNFSNSQILIFWSYEFCIAENRNERQYKIHNIQNS